MHDSSTLRLNALVDGAMNSLAAKDLAVYDMLIDAILAHHSTLSNQRADDVSAFVVTRLSGALRSLWRRGWQPIDVVSVIRRLESNDHGEVVAAAVAWESWIDRDQPMHPSWVSQLEDLHLWFPHREAMQHDWIPLVSGVTQLSRRDIVEHAVAALVRLVRLPVLPVLIPPPGLGAASPVGDQRVANRGQHSYGSIDPKMLSRVRALLAKAESTEFAEEADAFTEKAQQLIARYSIDVAMVAAASAGASIGSTAVRIHLEPPYIDAKSSLVNAVAMANSCRMVLHSDLGFVTVFGFPTDLAVVDMLFTSLLAQATHAMVIAGRLANEAGVSRTRSFRRTFLVAFASRIGERLAEATHTSQAQAEVEFGMALAPVLAQREVAVDEAVAAAFPNLKSVRTRVSNADGWHAGRAAADNASLARAAALRGRRP